MAKTTRPPLDAGAALLVVLWAVTFVHHLYGGIAFDSPERGVIALVFTLLLVGTLGLYRLGTARRWAGRAYRLLVVVVWIGFLGLYEGGFNHTLHVILRWAGDGDAVQRLYPAGSDAVVSQDVFFQSTGVLTLLVAIGVGFTMLRRPAHAA
ncbi:hypothetical protein ACN27G_26455 [Plantactinospora sp. WMMB334]|uniref:hypothetical protein n=1 Tax=Plantactinospora sp. WMMB334 TaxID=3404119 RepID=UPI003B9552A6